MIIGAGGLKQSPMLFNYLKIAIRNIRRSASYTIINVSGLALGIACALIIFSIVSYHLSFDTFHSNTDRIYRFVTESHRDIIDYDGNVPPAFGRQFREDYTYGEKVARISTEESELVTIDHGGTSDKFKERIAFADPEFFEVFKFPLISGTRGRILTEQNTALITEKMARKWFGDESPIDKVFRLNNKIDFRIVGILDAIPVNTEFQSEIYLSYNSLKQYDEWLASDDSWGGIRSSLQTFTRLRPGVTASEVENVLPSYVKKFRPKSKNVHHYKLQPIDEMHFDPRYGGSMSRTTILVLAVIGSFLVFTACLNFINLATAQAVSRSKEVGVRKALGSIRRQLFWQFSAETGVIVMIATTFAYGAATVAMPFINQLFATQIHLNVLNEPMLLVFLFVLMLAVTLLAGSYPGLVLSGFNPVAALRGRVGAQAKGNINLRRLLITTQFVISQVLLVGLIVVVAQMHYFQNAEMGFDLDATAMIPIGSVDTKSQTLRNRIQDIAGVEHVTRCFAPPASDWQWTTSFTFENKTEAENFSVSFKGADENYIETFGIPLIAGRNLVPSDTAREFLVNEVMLAKLGIADPEDILGKILSVNGQSMTGPVVGVVSDFHDGSLKSVIKPVVITTSSSQYNFYGVKMKATNLAETLVDIEKVWTEMYPDQIYAYEFVNEQTAGFYKAEETMLVLIKVFSVIALIIGCMGLYGLVSFMSVQKTKEIGIRKVLGGTVVSILWIFGKEFAKLILIAFLISAPIGWMLMSQWLQNYEYKITLSPWIFILEMAVLSVVVLLTVGFKSVKAAIMNPATALRSE